MEGWERKMEEIRREQYKERKGECEERKETGVSDGRVKEDVRRKLKKKYGRRRCI